MPKRNEWRTVIAAVGLMLALAAAWVSLAERMARIETRLDAVEEQLMEVRRDVRKLLVREAVAYDVDRRD